MNQSQSISDQKQQFGLKIVNHLKATTIDQQKKQFQHTGLDIGSNER